MDAGERQCADEQLSAAAGAPTVASADSIVPAGVDSPDPANPHIDRFAPKTRQILAAATEQARQLGHREIRPEHLLLALLLEPDTGVTRPLRTLLLTRTAGRLTLSSLREGLVHQLQSIEPAGLPGVAEPTGLSDGCKQVLQAALIEANRLNSSQVGPAHLLLGLVEEGSALAGSEVVALLAVRGLRVALGSRAWRPAVAGSPLSSSQSGAFRVAPGQPGPEQPATRDNVITFRVTDADLAAIDALVDTGAMRTRSEASAWLVQSGVSANADFFDQIRQIGDEIARLRHDVQRLTEERIGGRTSTAAGSPDSTPADPTSEQAASGESGSAS